LQSDAVGTALRVRNVANKVVATICASEQALSEHGIGVGRTITSHPSVRDAIVANSEHARSHTRLFARL
jgi:protein DJ-1